MIKRLDKKLYPHSEHRWDDKIFREIILNNVEPSDVVLDLGAGAGRVSEMDFIGSVKTVYGIDPDKSVESNPYLDKSFIGSGEKMPFDDAAFDVVISDNVLEHLTEPDNVLREVKRVLKPGGLFMFKTPNKNHYMPLVARLTPHSFHKWINKKRGRKESDTFPTQYLANSKGDIQQLAKQSGLNIKQIKFFEGRPEYMRFSTPTYLLGWFYERIVNKFKVLEKFRILMVGILQKPKGENKH